MAELTMTGREWTLTGDAVLAEHGPGLVVTLTEPADVRDAMAGQWFQPDWFGVALPETCAAFYRPPFASWADVCGVWQELGEKTDADGRPMIVNYTELAAELGRRRWPGVTFRFAPELTVGS